jgi:hypothetical protein
MHGILLPQVAANTEEEGMVGRLDGKRVIVTDPTEYNVLSALRT